MIQCIDHILLSDTILQKLHPTSDHPWKLTPRSEPTLKNIQSAILQTTGAVTTCKVIITNNRFLHNTNFSVERFLEAANSLQSLGLGKVVTVGKLSLKAFIKKPPSEVADILNENFDLCSPEYYEERYNQPLSRTVSLSVRHQLMTAKLVPKQLLM